MQELLKNKFRKDILSVNDDQNGRLATYQVRFSDNENKQNVLRRQ